VKALLIADIHGNRLALDTVLADVEDESFDAIFCLGDIAELGAQPAEAIGRLRELECPVILGNTDAHVSERAALNEHFDGNEGIVADLDRWTLDQLSASDFTFMSSLHRTYRDEQMGLLCFHGSPRSFNDRITPTTPEEQIAEWATEDAPVMAGGHTHHQMTRHWSGGLIVNPGSVGLALRHPNVGMVWEQVIDPKSDAAFTPWAEYAVLEVTEDGRNLELRRIRFDLDAYFEAARSKDMPHIDWWTSRWARA
jgi:predicted phosphodiesterase